MTDLKTSLHDWAARSDAGAPPVDALIKAGTRRRARNRAAGAGVAALALAGVVGVALAPGASTGSPSTTTAAAPAPATPAMELAAAATSTADSTYAFTIDATLTLADWQIDHVTTTCKGAVDPGQKTGVIKSGHVEARLVSGEHYISKDTVHWVDRGRGTVADFMLCGDDNVPSVTASDPSSILQSLKKAGTVTKTAGGYTFTADNVTGTVQVADGKITEFAYQVDQKKSADYPAYSRDVTMKLSAYGEKVSVAKPL
ncbi:hypothetical protein [Actinoplanes sp. NPDC051851]|uniref:hypothetical protein n=1 Tax=Actinoplanes sp. NPDC051851 TaxID=3154753 RepID=UPI00341F082D